MSGKPDMRGSARCAEHLSMTDWVFRLTRARASAHHASMQERTIPDSTPKDFTTAASEFLNLHELVVKARQNLNQNDWDYIVGGCESETTLRRNRLALDCIAFRPRVLRDVSAVDATVS